eukprot:2783353-Rhodomonas_salina.3
MHKRARQAWLSVDKGAPRQWKRRHERNHSPCAAAAENGGGNNRTGLTCVSLLVPSLSLLLSSAVSTPRCSQTGANFFFARLHDSVAMAANLCLKRTASCIQHECCGSTVRLLDAALPPVSFLCAAASLREERTKPTSGESDEQQVLELCAREFKARG